MESQSLPQEIASAIEDLRHIRHAVDTARSNHPLRLVARPLLQFAIVTGGVVLVLGVGAQLLVERSGSLFGLPLGDSAWLLIALLLGVGGIVKLAVIDAASRRVGYDVVAVLRATYTPAYLQIMLPGALTILLGAAALHRLGGDGLILGFASAGFGALVVAVSASVALPEWSVFGALLFVLGAVSMFALPDWPFYALALCWGVSLVVGGAALLQRFPEVTS